MTTESKMQCCLQWKGRPMSTFTPMMRGGTELQCRSARKWIVSTMFSVMFRDLNARMCGLKQGMNEPIKAYYE